jgi:2-polyprenyl-3-methyl-5-hydroxy-6-metoxy-1,4-benzoquinol methylase
MQYSEPSIPPSVTNRILPPEQEMKLRKRLARYHGENQVVPVEDDLQNRPYWFRHRYLPWLGLHLPLDNAMVLEVGCGTGASTIQIAELGANVLAIDVRQDALDVLMFRAALHGVEQRIRTLCLNAAEISSVAERYDIVFYTAALEHMTHRERQSSLAAAWNMLEPGKLLAVVDTPNRLWYYDQHTSFSYFYHWLPDDVAFDYSMKSSRTDFVSNLTQSNADERLLKLTRWGRGVSYHDFELAIGQLEGLQISGEWDYQRKINPAWAEEWAGTVAGRYKALLQEMMPNLPAAWFELELALVIRK